MSGVSAARETDKVAEAGRGKDTWAAGKRAWIEAGIRAVAGAGPDRTASEAVAGNEPGTTKLAAKTDAGAEAGISFETVPEAGPDTVSEPCGITAGKTTEAVAGTDHIAEINSADREDVTDEDTDVSFEAGKGDATSGTDSVNDCDTETAVEICIAERGPSADEGTTIDAVVGMSTVPPGTVLDSVLEMEFSDS
jgi:hypothetical protein